MAEHGVEDRPLQTVDAAEATGGGGMVERSAEILRRELRRRRQFISHSAPGEGVTTGRGGTRALWGV